MFLRIIVITAFLSLIPLNKFYAKEQGLLVDMANIILCIVTLIILPLSVYIKSIILLVLLYIFYINIEFFILFIQVVFRASFGKFLKERDNSFLRQIVTKLYTRCFNFKHNFGKLPEYPTIIVANYIYDRLENTACIMIPKDMTIILGDILAYKVRLNHIVKDIIITKATDKNCGQYERIKQQIAEKYKQGMSIFAYVTKCIHKNGHYIGRLRSGLFRISQELKIPITPVAIDYIHDNYGIIPRQNFRICVGDTFQVQDINKDMQVVRRFFKEKMRFFVVNKFSNS